MKYLLLFLSSVVFAANFSSDIDKTFKEAKKEKKPIIIDFYGIWCPPCNELDAIVFESRGFLEKSKAFKLLKVDAEKESSWKLKDRYQVGGYPTIVFTDSNGKESYRITGFRAEKEFLRVMNLVLTSKSKDFKKACAGRSEDDLWSCATVCSERKDVACTNKALLQLKPLLKPGTAKYDLAETYSAENSATEDLKYLAYEQLLTKSPDSPQALLWANTYWELASGVKQKAKKELIEKMLQNYANFQKDSRNEELGLSETDRAQMRAELLGKIGKEEESKAAWKEAAVLLESKAKELGTAHPERGFTIERISALEASGESEKALQLATDYREKFPVEFTFHYKAASLLKGQKKFNEALVPAKKAYSIAYGDNKIRVATLLIQLYTTIPDKKAAQGVYEEIKKNIKPSDKLQVRTHNYLKKMDQAYDKLAGAKS